MTSNPKPTVFLTLLLVLVAAPLVSEGLVPRDTPIESHVLTLVDPALEGRLTGTEGARQAAAYLKEQLEILGAQPLPGQSSFEIPFEFTSGSKDTGSKLAVGDRTFDTTEQVQALSFSDAATIEGELVFAGYGLKVPESQDFGYDSYATLDVTDKIVVVLRYFPEDVDQEMRSRLARYSGLRYKALIAREQGAKGLLVVSGPNSPNAGKTIPMTFDTAISGSGIVAASISGEVAEALFARQDTSVADAQTQLDTGNPHITGFALGATAKLDVAIERETRTGYNVAAVLPRSEAGSEPGVDERWVLLGAHYDHLGRGSGGNSLATGDEQGDIHVGADDNASGVAAVLEAARQLVGMQRQRDIVLTFWSGEELGLLGSSDFVADEILPLAEVAGYLNFDMVGRSRDNKLTLQAVGSSPDWTGLIERSNVPVGFDITLQQDPYLPTDTSAFNSSEVPTLNFFTGSHADYHRPSDTADKLNYEDLERVSRLGALVAHKLANLEEPPEFVKVERKVEAGGSRDSLRAYTGTIPDYTTEVEGLLLSGVMEGGPAAEAGLRKGDVIVEFAGQAIKNIYDYTYALDAVKIDVPVQVIFLRDGERIEITLTPRARQ
ncbi:MAG: M20/M25/M40 family metallo-hydrolase [Acidobacteriota bacterium]